MKYILIYLLTTVVFFTIDMLWLGWIAKGFYREKLGYLMAPQVNWAAALIFYFIYIAGILYFVIVPCMQQGDGATVLLNGALLGLLCYATYDLTNMATVRDWPLSVVIVDILWGIFLTAATAFISYSIIHKVLKWQL